MFVACVTIRESIRCFSVTFLSDQVNLSDDESVQSNELSEYDSPVAKQKAKKEDGGAVDDAVIT